MVFEAHKPHPNGYKTFFGYFKDDGFQKTKHMGRVNKGNWEAIRDHWQDLFINRQIEVGMSVLQSVTAEDEWCAEAYIKTDYNTINEALFSATAQQFIVHRLLNSVPEQDGGATS